MFSNVLSVPLDGESPFYIIRLKTYCPRLVYMITNRGRFSCFKM